MDGALRVSLFGAAVAIVLLLVVLELVRVRRLQERYALLWLATAIVLFALSLWTGGVSEAAHFVGIAYPPAFVFAVSVVFVVVVLLHFSTVISRLVLQNVSLAQSLALLEQRVRELEGRHETHASPGAPTVGDRGDDGSPER
jgi:hypothetical protein